MPLSSGTRLGPYEIGSPIGKGGMGEVYRAQDTKLKREVAIKVLPEEFANDKERLARFQREAQILASLNHPNIASIYGLEESDGVKALVLELVQGPTLAERIQEGPIPVDETVAIARQIAEALEAGHDAGVIHRDLKPANVKLKEDGTVKVLDYGLAKALQVDMSSGADAELSQSPTLTRQGTQFGVILGTVPYMSPEQARGKTVDKRADIWALGCVLYECLAGRRPFQGESTTDVLAQIVSQQPDFDSLPRTTPEFLTRLLRRCLEKDPRRRLRDAGELRIAIEEFQSNPDSGVVRRLPGSQKVALSFRSVLPWALVVLLGAWLGYALVGSADRSDVPTVNVSRWSIAIPARSRIAMPSPGGEFNASRMVAISPDGSRIAFSVRNEQDQAQLYLKAGSPVPRPIPGTMNGRGPFFSPDGEWLGFYDDDDTSIYKVALAGGSPQKLCDVGNLTSFDAAWAPDGKSIVFATGEGLWQVSADGGPVEQLTRPDVQQGEVGHHSPKFTPDGRGVFFTVSITPETHLALLSLDTGSWETIIPNGSLGVPIEQGRIVFARSGELLAARYDPVARRVTGSIVSVRQDIETTSGLGGMVLTQFDVSATGTLAYVPAAATRPPDQLLWVDLSGKETVISEGPGTWVHPRLSPDGSRVSIDIHAPDGMRDIHIYELERGQFRQLTRTGMSWESEWRPDGERIAILSGAPAGQWSLFWAPTDFSGPAELLFQSGHAIPASWLPDGKSLLFTDWVEGGIWRMSPDGDRQPQLVMRTQAQEGFPRLSPDGKWIAFVETESGRREVFVRSFPNRGPTHKVSIEGGGEAVWSRDGRRLFFRRGDQMFAVDVDDEAKTRFGAPRLLFTGRYDSAQVGHQHYDISLQNDRFLMVKHGEPEGPGEVRVVLNWFEELKRLVPADN